MPDLRRWKVVLDAGIVHFTNLVLMGFLSLTSLRKKRASRFQVAGVFLRSLDFPLSQSES